jgi:hypothetical protein
MATNAKLGEGWREIEEVGRRFGFRSQPEAFTDTHRPVRLYIADLGVRVVIFDGEVLRHLEIDPTRLYQGRGRQVE